MRLLSNEFPNKVSFIQPGKHLLNFSLYSLLFPLKGKDNILFISPHISSEV